MSNTTIEAQFARKELERAIAEFIEAAQNLLDSDFENVDLRIKQIVSKVSENRVINTIINPLLEAHLPADYGAVEKLGRTSFNVPVNEDEELAVIMQLLAECSTKKNGLLGLAFSLYHKKYHDDNLERFKQQYILPSLQKLERRLKYLMDDLSGSDESIESQQIRIFNITATQSNIAIGQNNSQSNNATSAFASLRGAVDQIDDNNEKANLRELIETMEKSQNSPRDFQKAYNDFLLASGKHMAVIGPLLGPIAQLLSQ